VGVKQMLAKDMRGGMPAARSLVSCTLHARCCCTAHVVQLFHVFVFSSFTLSGP
jgi:hypothetical protein